MVLAMPAGSWAEWVGAAGTVGAFVATFILLRHEVGDRRRAQPRMVSAWRRRDGRDAPSVLYMRNGGEEAIYSVTVRSAAGNVMGFWRVIPGGVVVRRPWTDDADQNPISSVTFHDAAGRGWRRDTHGILHPSKHKRVDPATMSHAVQASDVVSWRQTDLSAGDDTDPLSPPSEPIGPYEPSVFYAPSPPRPPRGPKY